MEPATFGMGFVTESSTEAFFQACGAPGPLRLVVERPAGTEAFRPDFDRPFALVGRERWADLTLDDTEVSRRHAYLQVIAGRLFCLDLESRTGVRFGGQLGRSGWLTAAQPAGIGPFELRPALDDPPAGPSDDWDPLAALPPEQDTLPAVSLEVIVGRKGLVWRMNRVLALVGQADACKVRVRDQGVGPYHCSLLRTPVGLWVVDLLGSGGTSVNRTPVRFARLAHGDELLVGDTLFSVSYDRPPEPVQTAVSVGLSPPGLSESDRLRAELEVARADAEALRGRVAELTQAVDQVTAREAREWAAAEQRWQAELDSVHAEAADRERGSAAVAEALRAELASSREAAAQQQADLDAARSETDTLRSERDHQAEQAEAARAETAAERQRWVEAEAAREETATQVITAVAVVEVLRQRVEELERSAAEAAQGSEAQTLARSEEVARWDAERQGLHDRWDEERRGREADRRTAAEALDAAQAEFDLQLSARQAEAVAAGPGRELAKVEALLVELAAARGQLDEERAARRADADRHRSETAALRQAHDALARRVEELTEELDRLVPHGVELSPAMRKPVEPGRPARADATQVQLQRQLAEAARQLQEARERAARLEAELRGRQQFVTLQVHPVTLPPDKGGPARG